MYGSSLNRGRFKKNFRFDTICKIAENHKKYIDCAYGFIDKPALIKIAVVV